MEALLSTLSHSHTLFSRKPRRSQEKFVFTYCNLQGIIFYTFVKFLVRCSDQVWHDFPSSFLAVYKTE